MATQVKTLAEQAKELNQVIPFGLSIITKYSSGKIAAKMVHGNNEKVSVRVSYDYSLNTNENHLHAALVLLEKIKAEYEKEFVIEISSYNEKNDGYIFVAKRVV